MREAFKLLDYVSYFDLLGIEQPESQLCAILGLTLLPGSCLKMKF
jgi:hypothetical protein